MFAHTYFLLSRNMVKIIINDNFYWQKGCSKRKLLQVFTQYKYVLNDVINQMHEQQRISLCIERTLLALNQSNKPQFRQTRTRGNYYCCTHCGRVEVHLRCIEKCFLVYQNLMNSAR